MKPRYEKECIQLGELANEALNLPKNVNKPRFESLQLREIFKLLDNEVLELKDEFFTGFIKIDNIRENLEFECIINELSDVLACCAGLLAKINTLKQIQQYDGA